VKKSLLALTVLALCSLSFAGDSDTAKVNQKRAAAQLAERLTGKALFLSPSATATCSFTFTSGANDNFLQYCVTANGNIAQFETPQGFEHIAHGVVGEGYGVCDVSSNTEYFDYSFFGDSPNWLAPTVVNQTPTSVKIARITADGVWTLTQTFTQMAGTSPFVKVEMALKNNTAVDRTIFLMRFADVEPDHSFSPDLGATSNSAFVWDQTTAANVGSRNNFGLLLQGLPIPQQQFPDLGPQGFVEADTFVTPPAPCNPYLNFASGSQSENAFGTIVMIYSLGVPKKKSKSVTVNYRGM
jgi:hypothetical protein